MATPKRTTGSVAHQKSKQYDDAAKEFKRAYELNSDLWQSVYNLGMTYKAMDDKERHRVAEEVSAGR